MHTLRKPSLKSFYSTRIPNRYWVAFLMPMSSMMAAMNAHVPVTGQNAALPAAMRATPSDSSSPNSVASLGINIAPVIASEFDPFNSPVAQTFQNRLYNLPNDLPSESFALNPFNSSSLEQKYGTVGFGLSISLANPQLPMIPFSIPTSIDPSAAGEP